MPTEWGKLFTNYRSGLVSRLYKELKNWTSGKQANLKMGYGTKQRFLKQCLKKFRKLFNVLNYLKNNFFWDYILLQPVRMSKINKIIAADVGWNYGETVQFIYCSWQWWKYKWAQILWQSMWRFLKNLKINLP